MGVQRGVCRDCTSARGATVYVPGDEFDEHQSAEHGYPSPLELEFWWSCWRKDAYRDEGIAIDAVKGPEATALEVYPCPHGQHWHIGHPRGVKVKPSDHRRQWRRRDTVPAVAELRAALAALSSVEKS